MIRLAFRLVYVALFVFALVLVMGGSGASARSGPISNADSSLPAPDAYGVVGTGIWEAECATVLPSASAWTFGRANRASTSPVNCSPRTNKNYIESANPANKVCLDFKKADRVGISFAAGNFKGQFQAKITGVASNPIKVTIDTYDSYQEGTGGIALTDEGDGIAEGDLGSSGLSTETMTFHAFQWLWTQPDGQPNKSGKVCVSPTGTKNPSSEGTTVTLDYFVVSNGKPMAIRGAATGATPMVQDDLNALWTWSADDFAFPTPECQGLNTWVSASPAAPNAPANWKGFIPKSADQLEFIGACVVETVIQKTGEYPNNIPRYWVIFNKPNGTDVMPDDPQRIANFIQNIQTIVSVYQAHQLTPPRIIIDAGSQLNMPGLGADQHTGGTWGQMDPSCATNYYDCIHRDRVWIDDFWAAAKPALVSANLLQYIGGIDGHYYQFNDNFKCNPAGDTTGKCRVNTKLVTDFVQAMKTWVDGSGISNPEVWMMETGTAMIYGCGAQPLLGSLAEQRDFFNCNGKVRNVRNYVGKLQQALGEQGIVNRWAWYADRYGTYNQCPQGGNTGEMTALNGISPASPTFCNGVQLSGFGTNYKWSAPYR